MTDKQIFKQRFEENYKGKRLLAIQLNGFTHTVFYDNKKKGEKVEKENISIDRYSGCMGQTEANGYGMNNTAVSKLFEGYPNYAYQNNAKEIVYVKP